MKLSIITINYNNLAGLQKTMQSVLSQTSTDFEYIVVDGSSADGSYEIIEQISKSTDKQINWISEQDNGIYHAMNKGIRMAKGEYVQFVNSGDCLVDENVTETMLSYLSSLTSNPSILYGNMLKQMPKGLLRDKGFAGRQPTMLDFYIGTLNHSPAYIKCSLFDKFGLYDESLKIASDFKWYIQAIIFGGINPEYVDIDVTLFDMNGISTVNTSLDKQERELVLTSFLPEKILKDYKKYSFPINQWERIQRYKLIAKFFWLFERCLFKCERIRKERYRF